MSVRSYVDGRRLNDRVTFRRPILDSKGDQAGWQLLIENVHAAVDGEKAKSPEPLVADGIRSVGRYTVWVRSDIIKRFGLTVADRGEWKGRYLDIKDAPDQGTAARLVPLICQTGVNQG